MATTSTNPAESLRIAIIGGGIAGISLAIGLARLPHIDAQLFEGAETFKERGAGVGLSGNAQRAMQLVDPALHDALDKAGAVQMEPSLTLTMGSGLRAEEILLEQFPNIPQLTVARYAFLQELLKLVPPGTAHVNKKVTAITELASSIGGVTLDFAGNSTHVCDAVIGADGIHSFVRRQLLGEDHPANTPQFGGLYTSFTLLPATEVRARLGETYLAQKTQVGWLGQGSFLMTDLVDGGERMQVVAAITLDEWPHESKWANLPKEKVSKRFEGWGKWGQAFVEMVSTQPEMPAMAVFEHIDVPTYARDRLCITGDAAHAFTPWQGSGAGQALEDTLLLSRLLSHTTHPSHLAPAFAVFDKHRRPRTQAIAASSRETGRIFCGLDLDVGLDLEKLRKKLAPRLGLYI